MLSQGKTADDLRSPLLDQIRVLCPDAVVTTNPGCALHLSQGLRAAKLDIPVVHPVSILLKQVR
jgi:glycolate oxidase iron-sulfur subunit